MLKAFDQFRSSQSQIIQGFDKRHLIQFRAHDYLRKYLAHIKKAASGIPDAAMTNELVNDLKREIHASPDHSEIIVWTIHKIPTEITDPTDVRS